MKPLAMPYRGGLFLNFRVLWLLVQLFCHVTDNNVSFAQGLYILCH